MADDEHKRPAAWRRIIAIVVYVFAWFLVMGFAAYMLESEACIKGGRCSNFDYFVDLVFSLGFWIGVVFLVRYGWLGKLNFGWGKRGG